MRNASKRTKEPTHKRRCGKLQTVVPSASLLRPDSAGGARDALIDGKTIEVPNSQTMKLLRSWASSGMEMSRLSVEVNEANKGWTVLRRL